MAYYPNLQKTLRGDVLPISSRNQVQQRLIDDTTGSHRLKAGLPANWQIGENTGTHWSGANDIGIIWPPNRAPVLVSAYLTDSSASIETKEASIAAVGKLVSDIAF
ncbi:MAG: hypothetical protein DM484_09835 [Candidatus Methylumidiphilus alinenensis]|uniref:beta-lactamase n=1 Tax=Candidatus Methylumidiphilus alinenensis TaxID=2202197 RepID=A0A2W4RCE2_9GAMM|nr:MAG: hypothetical protein DM484_09835 [Candidatus Methylumidiphilus alinenensis]